MNYTQIQSYLAGCITADSQLSLLGAPVLVDPFADPEVAKSAVAALLRQYGVCFEIGFPEVDVKDATQLGGTTPIDALCHVFLVEHNEVTHTPSEAALVMRLITALTKPPTTPGQKPARIPPSRLPQYVTEAGYIAHIIPAYVPMNIKQP